MPTARRVDLFRLHHAEYVAPRHPRVITVGKGQYLSAEGRGQPGGAPFRARVEALYGMAWTLKTTKKKLGKDFRVMPLEALWWSDAGELLATPEAEWRWKMLLRVPNFVRRRDLAAAAEALAARGRGQGTGDVALEQLKEGRCVQALHLGPYGDERGTIERMARTARAHGLALHGRHHEIYLSDPRRVPPERLRTILRHPVRAAR
jgi:hypothetical protein